MSYDKIVIPELGVFSTGLLIPASRDTVFSQIPLPVLTKEEAIELLKDRQPRQEIFDSSWIKNQNGIGACAGYAAASAVERARWFSGQEYIELSGDGIYAAVNGGRDSGSTLEANMRWLTDNGVPPANLVPRHEYRKNRIPREAYEEAKKFRGFETYFIDSEMEIVTALLNDFPVVVAVHAGNGGLSPDGISDWRNGPGNHSVVVDDVRFYREEFQFQTANSWGTKWGVDGRAWLTWNKHLSTPIKYHRFYVIRAATRNHDEPQPPEALA
ncbi:MAG: hypothetical protein KatS3mg087_1387 [Patescibacteria group bacterium]|nr:MAG: hypothetical protein KatS3mg087_1387 [Patescibacteria group bacterium]